MTRYSITLDLTKYTTQLSLPCKNTDFGREIAITLHQNGVPYTLTADNYAVFVAKKTSGADIVNDCVVDLVNNCVVYTITSQTIAEIGNLPCEIQLFGYDREQIGSPTFNILVRKAILRETNIESSSEYGTMNKIINDVKRRLDNGEFDGKDGINPLVRINDVTHEWEVSYDNGESWQSLDTQAEPRSVYLSSEAGQSISQHEYEVENVSITEGMSLKVGDIVLFQANSTISRVISIYGDRNQFFSCTPSVSIRGKQGLQGIPGISIRSCVFPYSGSSVEYAIGSIEAIANYPIKSGDLVIFNGEYLAVIQNVDTSKNVFTVGQKVFYIKGEKGDKGDGVPTVTKADDGKFLRVRGGIVVAEDTRYTLNGTYAMKNEINLGSYYGFEEEVSFKIYNGNTEAYGIRVVGDVIQAYIYLDYKEEYAWQGIYSSRDNYWSGGFYKLVFDDVQVSEQLYRLITDNGGDPISRELIDDVDWKVGQIDTTVKNHTTSLEKNTSDIEKHSVTLTYHDKRITNMEKGLPSDRFITDASVAYVKDVPTNACPYAAVTRVGGMSRKSNNLFDVSKFNNAVDATYEVTDGVITVNGYLVVFRYFLQENKTYTFKALSTRTGSGGGGVSILYRNADNQDGGGKYYQDMLNPTATFTVPAGYNDVRIVLYGGSQGANTSATYTDVMLNEGATALPSEPHYEGIREVRVTGVRGYGTIGEISRMDIPKAVQALDGFGYGVNEDCFNYIDLEERRFVKRVEKVDISTLAWSYDSTNKFFNVLFSKRKGGANFICDLYEKTSAKTDAEMASASNMTICSNNDDSGAWLNIKNTAYADVASFKAAMQGVYLYYEAQGVSMTDIDDILAEDNLIRVEGGGTLTFVNEQGYPVPSTIIYQVKEG